MIKIKRLKISQVICKMRYFLLILFLTSVIAKPIKINVNNFEEKCISEPNNFTIDNLNYSYSVINNVTCSLCKTLVSTIDIGIIKSNNTIQEITEIIKDICCVIHGPSGEECVFILNNIQQIVKYITNGLTSLEICKKLHLCS